jgi:CHASE2 domain-containing sensor protein
MGWVLARIAQLRATGGKGVADALVVIGVTIVAGAAALALNTITPVRFIENLTSDFRLATGAPPAQADTFAIIKVDDTALEAMREASPCHCLAPIDKLWLADLMAALDAKGVKAIGVDYLLDTWASPEEFKGFQERIANVKAPIVAVVDPNMKPGVDFPVDPKIRYADARALVPTDYDAIVRRYDPWPGKSLALATEVGVAAVGLKPPRGKFDIRYRAPDPKVEAEDRKSVV